MCVRVNVSTCVCVSVSVSVCLCVRLHETGNQSLLIKLTIKNNNLII